MRLLLVLLMALPLAAQENPLLQDVLKHWKISKEFTLKVAAQMPEDKYTFKPTPDQMTFGEQVLHIAEAEAFYYSVFEGKKMDRLPRDKMDKETLLKILAEHYDMGTKLFSSLTAEQLKKMYKLPMGMMNGHEFLMLTLDHATHHRAQMEMYLRLNGIKPTAYTF